MSFPIDSSSKISFLSQHQVVADVKSAASEIDLDISSIMTQNSSCDSPSIRVTSAISIDVEVLENDELEINNLLTQLELMNPEQVSEAKKWVDEVRDKVIEKILMSNDKQAEEINLDLEVLQPFLLEEVFFREIAVLEIGVVTVNVAGRVATATAMGMLLNQVREVIRVKEGNLQQIEGEGQQSLEKEIEVLKKWLSIQTLLFNDQIKNAIIASCLSVPKMATGILRLVESAAMTAGAKTGVTSMLETVGMIGLGGAMIGFALQIHGTSSDLQEHKIWTQVFENNGLDFDDAQRIVDKQQAIFKSRLSSNEQALKELLERVTDDLKQAESLSPNEQAKAVVQALETLEREGITVNSEEIGEEEMSLDQLQALLSDFSSKSPLNMMMVKKKEALAVSIRNALKTFSHKKKEIDEGFLRLRLNKAKGLFVSAQMMMGLTILFKVLAIIGIAAAGVVLVALSYGLLAAVISSMIIGGIYFYVKKPNLFKTYIQGVQANLFFRKIPLAIQKYRKHYTLLQSSKIAEDVKALGVRMLILDKLLERGDVDAMTTYLQKHSTKKALSEGVKDPKRVLREYKDELELKQNKKLERHQILSEKLNRLNASVSQMEVKVIELKRQIEQAGWMDFYKHLKGNEELVKNEEGFDYAEILADALLKDPTLLEDGEMKNLLAHMGIDMKKIQALPQNATKQEVLGVIRSFFAMEEDAIMKMIRKQKLAAI